MSPIQFTAPTRLTTAQLKRLDDLFAAMDIVRGIRHELAILDALLDVHGGLDHEHARLAFIGPAIAEVQKGIYREWRGLSTLKDKNRNRA